MKSEKLQDAIGEVRDAYIRDADVVPAKKKDAWVKWAAVAACAVIVLAAAGVPFLLGKANGNTGQSELPTEAQSLTLSERLRQYGLSAQVVEGPIDIAVSERPQITREEAAAHLRQAELFLVCTVEEIDRVTMQEPGSDNTWYITQMTLCVDSVIRGEMQEDRVRVVNAAVTNEPVEFLSYPGLEECREQMQAAFILRKLDESDVWTIGETDLPITELGAYFIVDCMGYDETSVQYDGFSFPLPEIE